MRRTLALAGAAVLGVTGLASPASADPGFDGVVVHEVAAELVNASGTNGPLSGGFVEIMNTNSTGSVDLAGWTVRVCTTTTTFSTTIDPGTSIAAGEVYVIADVAYDAVFGPSPDEFFDSGIIEQAAGGVRLLEDTTLELENEIKWDLNDPNNLCNAAPDVGVDPTDLESINRVTPLPWVLEDPTPTLP